jgi:hypothetical protein
MVLTDEHRTERNRARCKRYYELNKEEGRKRRVLNAIKSKGYFPRDFSTLSTLEFVDAFHEYQSRHTPSEFALRKYRSILACK